jgi:uncharacterized protein with GYD domain
MAYYLLQVTYSSEAWAALVDEPQNRTEAVRATVEQLGGTVHSTWLAFGEYDVVSIFELPDNIRAAAISMAISAGGAVKAIKTTPLMTWEEGVEAMQAAAQEAAYQPPIGVFRSVRSEDREKRLK